MESGDADFDAARSDFVEEQGEFRRGGMQFHGSNNAAPVDRTLNGIGRPEG
jgi:hypothetical protein